MVEALITGGLTSRTAAERLAEYGPNDPAPRTRRSRVLDFVRLFLNPLVIVLLIAATASAVLGDVTDAGIIIAIVMLSNTEVTDGIFVAQRDEREDFTTEAAVTANASRDSGAVRYIRHSDKYERKRSRALEAALA